MDEIKPIEKGGEICYNSLQRSGISEKMQA